jgi:cardiolipin synthase A/B
MPSLHGVNRLSRLLLAWLLTAPACVHYENRRDLRIHEDLPSSGEALSLALFQSVGVGLSPGHAVELLQDERIIEALEEEVEQARESLHLLVATWQPGAVSERLVGALAARRRDVACRILVDPLYSPRFQEEVAPRLADAGCEVRLFRPFPGQVVVFDEPRLEARNHRQLVIRDGASGLTGGSGVGQDWRDTHVRVRGPAVRELQQAFARGWQEAGGGLLPASAFPSLESEGEARAAFIASTGSIHLSHSERMMQVLIATAKHRLWLTNACFIPTTATVDMLIRKASAGVDVRVLVPGPRHGDPRLRVAQRTTYQRLLENGVRIWEYQPALLQARTLLVDERLAAVGSTNLEPRSHASLEEGSLVVEDERLARSLAEGFERDLTHAVEIQPEGWKQRGLLERLPYELPRSSAHCP